MNIFKILGSGDGKIKEPSITEFLAFILDPYCDHGLGAHFLESFLKPIVFEHEQFKFLRKNEIENNSQITSKVAKASVMRGISLNQFIQKAIESIVSKEANRKI